MNDMGSLKLQNPLLIALEESDPKERIRTVIELFDNDQFCEDKNKQKDTLIHIAAFKGFEDIFEELIKRNVKLDSRCDKGVTPLHLAIKNNHFNIVKTLVKYGVNVNEFSIIRQSSLDIEDGQKLFKITPFELAFHYKNYPIINLLLENKAKAQATSGYEIRKMSIYWAVNKDFRGIAKLILQDPDQIANANLMRLLASCKSVEMVELLFKYFNFQPNDNFFQIAVECDMIEVVKFLIKNGEARKINMKYVDEFWPLEHAIENNSLKMVQILLDNGAETDKIVQPYNLTYLHKAVNEGKLELVEIFIRHGLNVNAEGDDSWNPLYTAVLYSHFEIAKLLIASGAKINAKTAHPGLTPLMAAIVQDNKEMMKLLIENGASLSVKSEFHLGASSLEYALCETKIEILKTCLYADCFK